MAAAGVAVAVALIAVATVIGMNVPGADDESASAAHTPAPAGMRYDYLRDVRVTVPDDWAYDTEPGSDWCADGNSLPDRPYVSVGGSGAVADIGCPPADDDTGEFSDEAPHHLWAAHLSLTAHQDDTRAGSDQRGEWWVLTDQVGDVDVKAVSKDRTEAERLLASAVVVDRTEDGCTPHGSIQDGFFPRPEPGFDVAALTDIDSIVVCYYTALDDADVNGLESTTVIEGDRADAVLEAIQAAPLGGGPDRANNCSDSDTGDTAYELHLRSGGDTDTMYVYFSSCHGNGFDDGTNLRELTTAGCRPLMQPPVRVWGGASASAIKCMAGVD